MKLRAIMKPLKELTVLNVDTKASEAMKQIEETGLLSLPVVTDYKFMGFLSKQYILDAVYKEGKEVLDKPVTYFIHNRVEAMTSSDDIEKAAEVFFKTNIRFIPIVEKDEFLGIVTQKSIFELFTKIYGFQNSKLVILTNDYKGLLSSIADIVASNGGNITNVALLDAGVMNLKELTIRVETDDVLKIVNKLKKNGVDVREFSY